MTQSLATTTRDATATQEQVLAIIRDVLGRPQLGPDDDVFDHGATSLSFVRILARVHQDLQLTVHAAALGGIATARNITAAAGGTGAEEGV